MRIAYMSLEFPPRIFGGLGVYVDEISREMVSQGEKISVFTLGDGKLKRYQDMDGVEVFRETPVPIRDGLEIFLSPETISWGEGLYLLLDLFSLNQLAAARLMENGPFDLCVAHDWLGLLGAMAVKREGIPMIYHVHGLETGRSDNPNPQLVTLEKKRRRSSGSDHYRFRGHEAGAGLPGSQVGKGSRMLPRRGRRIFQSRSG